MKKNKSGFTLSEVLLMLMIVGIIMALSIQTFKMIQSSYTPLAYYADNNVKMIVRTLFLGRTAQENTVLCKKADGSIISILRPDGISQPDAVYLCSQLYAASSGGGESRVCNAMVDFINVSGGTNCGNLYSVAYDAQNNNEPYISDITDGKSPTFITTNGHRYYLSGSQFSSNVSSELGFRVLAVDLNGSRRPNSSEFSASAPPPDIINFLIMDNGEVYPLGAAADNISMTDKSSKKTINIRYIASSVKGYCRRGLNKSDCQNVLSTTASVPPNCVISGKPDSSKCGFVDQSLSSMSYRQAYCASIGLNATNDSMAYSAYCQPVEDSCMSNSSQEFCNYLLRCPPSGYSGRYDSCKQENIKPIFRFNFN